MPMTSIHPTPIFKVCRLLVLPLAIDVERRLGCFVRSRRQAFLLTQKKNATRKEIFLRATGASPPTFPTRGFA
jgi:hypothetical protein